MASEWFYTQDGKTKAGPASPAQLQALAKSGQLRPTDLVWKAGMAEWMPARTIKGLFPSDGGAATVKKPPTTASKTPGTDKNRPKPRPTSETQRSRVSDDEAEPSEQRVGNRKVFAAVIAGAAIAGIGCLGGAIVVWAMYLNSASFEKTLAEKKEKPKEGQVAEKKEAPTEQPKDKGTEKTEVPIVEPKEQVAAKPDLLVPQLTKVTSAQYQDFGFKKYGFGQSKQELKGIIKLRNLVPSLDEFEFLTSFSSYGWIPTANSENVPNEFFYFNDDKLVGFGKLYLGDNKAYMDALLNEFGKTPLEHVHALVHLHEDTTEPEKGWAMSRTYSYHFFPKTVAGICAVHKKTISQEYQWIEFCLFEREWFEDTLHQHFVNERKKLEKRKQAAGQAKVVSPPPGYLTPYQRELWERSQQGEVIRVFNPDEPIGEAAVPFQIVDPKLRSYLAQAKSSLSMFVNGQIQFRMRGDRQGNRSFVKMQSGSFIYLMSESSIGRNSYQKWTGEDWSEPAGSMQALSKLPRTPPVSLEATRYNLGLRDKVHALQNGVFSSFYYAAYARLAQDYFPSRNPTITAFKSIKTGGQSYNPKLYEWDTDDGLGISIGYKGGLGVVRKEKKKL